MYICIFCFCCAKSATAKGSLLVKAGCALGVRIGNSLVRTLGEEAKKAGVPLKTKSAVVCKRLAKQLSTGCG